MNTVCDERTRLVDEIKRCNHTYQTYKRIHMMASVMAAYQRLEQHVDECPVCKQEEELEK
jgi:hypothetical protein